MSAPLEDGGVHDHCRPYAGGGAGCQASRLRDEASARAADL
jgi:hypothetical protein